MKRVNDEFNYVKIINEDDNPNFEYGSTPKEESASYKDNSDRFRDEVNDNPASNNENKSPAKKEKRRKEEQKEGSDKSSNGSSGSSSSSASSASGITAAGAAVVAAVSIVTGIVSVSASPIVNEISNVIFTPQETSIACAFDIENSDTSLKYKVELYNNDIEDLFEKECQIGHNEIGFNDLQPSTEYTFEIFRGSLNEQQEYNYVSIFKEFVSTLGITGPVSLSFDSDNRGGTMSSIELQANSEYTLPVSIFVPEKDEYFGGWKVNGKGEKLQPGETIVVKNNTNLLAIWDKFPTEETSVTANQTFFSYFPSQSSADITTVTLMDVDFQCQYTYCSPTTGSLNFDTVGGFVSTTRPFGGPIARVTINTSEAQSGAATYTMVYSASPIYEKTTAEGETHTIAPNSSYTFECTNPDARYFCLSNNSGGVEACMASLEFVYNLPVIETSYQVYFDANGGTGSFGPYTVSNKNQERLPDAQTVGFVAPYGYEFAGWKVQGVEDLLEAGTTIGISSDITLVAQWKIAPTYTVTFNSNGGSAIDSQTVVKGDVATRPDDPTRDGYVFLDWYIDEELTTPYNFESAITDDLELFAGWKPDADFSMYINYIDTLSSNPTYQLSFNYTKTDEHSVLTNYSLEFDGDTTVNLDVGSLDDATTYTTKTVEIDSDTAASLGTGIVNYTMKGTDADGKSYDLATGSLSMSRTQKDYMLFAYIGGEQLQEDNTGTTFQVMDIGTPSSSTYYIPLRFDYSDFNKTHGSYEWRLTYSLDGTTETNTTFTYQGGTTNVSISKNIFDETTKQVTLAKIYFKDEYSRQIGGVYQNVTLQASDERFVGGFQLDASNLVDITKTPSISLSACGERGTNPDNVDENYTFIALGVNEDNFAALLSFRLLSKGGTIEKEYTINLVSYLQNKATSSMTVTDVEFEFIDVESGEDKREEFIELSKRYVVDVELTITPPGGTPFVCTSYESYSFR